LEVVGGWVAVVLGAMSRHIAAVEVAIVVECLRCKTLSNRVLARRGGQRMNPSSSKIHWCSERRKRAANLGLHFDRAKYLD
jgi:hypothetical protein